MTDSQTNGTWKAISFRLILPVVSILFILMFLELGLRLFRPINYLHPPKRPLWNRFIHQPSDTPGLAYEMAPGKEKVYWEDVIVRTNSYGMRDYEPLKGESGSLKRIVVLGDSYTFGMEVQVEEAYPLLLEKQLNESPAGRDVQYDVLNFGVIGYSTLEEAYVLKHKALRWNPEVVVIGYVLNDPEVDPVQNISAYFQEPHWWQYSHLLRMIARVRNNWEVNRLGGGDYYRYLHAKRGPKWAGVVRAFDQIEALVSDRGIKILVVIFPSIYGKEWGGWAGSWADYPYGEIHKQVSDLATQHGFDVVDLYDVYSSYQPSEVVLAPWDEHPNRFAHALAAQVIAEKLLAGPLFLGFREKEERKR